MRLEAANWFSLLRAGASDADRAEFQAWRGAAARNGEVYDRMARQWDQSKFIANSGVGRARNLSSVQVWHRRPIPRYAAIAGLAVLIAGGGAVWVTHENRQAPATVIATSAGDIRTISLPDGSKVILDGNSKLRTFYSAKARRLDLDRGRARFEVAHDPDRPFIVKADGGTIIAHGTIFDVQRTPSQVRVVLFRGSVEVRGEQATLTDGTAGRMLRPGQALVYSHERPPSLPTAASPGDAQWASRMLSFDGTPLGDAVIKFNARNRVKITLASDRIASLRVSGAFRANDPQGFAQAVKTLFGLTLQRRPDGSLLLEESTKKS